MVPFQIKHRCTTAILFEKDCDSLKLCVEAAAETKADLRAADLRAADLSAADLSGAFYGDDLPLRHPPIQISGLRWHVLILDRHMQIGCELHSLADWQQFDDAQIARMSPRHGAEFWASYKEPLFTLARARGRE